MSRGLIMMSSSASHGMTVPQWTGRNTQDKPESAELDTQLTLQVSLRARKNNERPGARKRADDATY